MGQVPNVMSGGVEQVPSSQVQLERRALFRRLAPLYQNPKAVAGAIIVVIFILIALLAPLLANYRDVGSNFLPLQPPSSSHLFGTTDLGQDVFAEFVWGTRTSLFIGFLSGIGSIALSLVIGMASGFYGGWLDEVLQLITNIFLVIPGLPLMITLAAFLTFGGNLPVILVIILTGWAWGARIFRSQMMSLRSREYVESAQMAGESSWNIMMREIIPNMTSLIFANFLFSVVYAILSAASLQFLGLGDLNSVDWGSMLYWANNDGALMSGAWWWFIPPGLAIALFGAGLSLLNYAVDEFTNPKLRMFRKKKRSGVKTA